MISVLADQNLHKIDQFLPGDAALDTFDPSNSLPSNWRKYDALLIRTVTQIDASLLREGKPLSVSFIGSGSAGYDHVDLSVLKRKNIQFAHAPGCNARAVAEYVVTGLFIWAGREHIALRDKQIGVVGVGHVGTALQKLLDKLSLDYVLYDPPRDERDASFTSSDLDDLLACDILSFHTPLTHHGKYATHHWLDHRILGEYSFELVINAARGGVINEQDLRQFADTGHIGEFILDVWENEPLFDDDTARRAYLRTPHIAGYSEQAKSRASRMICTSLAEHFDLSEPTALSKSACDYSDFIDPKEIKKLEDVLTILHPLLTYQEELTQIIGEPPSRKRTRFARIRTGKPYRNEFAYLSLPRRLLDQYPTLKQLGIQSA